MEVMKTFRFMHDINQMFQNQQGYYRETEILVILIPCHGQWWQPLLTIKRRPHIIEVDVLGKYPVFREDKSLDHSYSEDVTEEQHSDPRCGEVQHSYTCGEKRRVEFLCVLYITVLCLVAQSCLTLCDPMDCSLQAPLPMGILQARIIQSGLPWRPPGIFPTQGSNPGLPHCRQFFTSWATREAHEECLASVWKSLII